MSNRQTVSQPQVDWVKYALLEQDGEQDRYRFTWRDKTTGDLIAILWTAGEIEEKVWERFITTPEIVDTSPEWRAETCSKVLEAVFLRLKGAKPLEVFINIFTDPEGKEAILDFARSTKNTNEFNLLQSALQSKWLKYSSPWYDYFKVDGMWWGAWLNISFVWNDNIRENKIQESSHKYTSQFIEVFERLYEPPNLTVIDILKDPTWLAATKELIIDAQWNLNVLFDALRNSLGEKWYRLSMPWTTYFNNSDNLHNAYIQMYKIESE